MAANAHLGIGRSSLRLKRPAGGETSWGSARNAKGDVLADAAPRA